MREPAHSYNYAQRDKVIDHEEVDWREWAKTQGFLE
jgi:hypothetical protein